MSVAILVNPPSALAGFYGGFPEVRSYCSRPVAEILDRPNRDKFTTAALAAVDRLLRQ
jgi:hypothetical protein